MILRQGQYTSLSKISIPFDPYRGGCNNVSNQFKPITISDDLICAAAEPMASLECPAQEAEYDDPQHILLCTCIDAANCRLGLMCLVGLVPPLS